MPSSSVGGRLVLAAPPEADALRTRLIWLTVFRTVAVSLSLIAVAVRLFVQPLEEPSRVDMLSFAVIGLVYVFTLVYGLMLRRGEVGRVAAAVQVVGDLVIASALVFLTGVGDSPFTFLYLLTVIVASMVLDGRGALISAGAGALAYASLLVAVKFNWLVPPISATTPTRGRFAFLMASNVLALFLIAVLAGYLARQLSATGGQLSARVADLKRLDVLQRQILACMPSGLITCNAAGAVTFVNRAAISILSLESRLAPGTHVEALLPGALGPDVRLRRRELTVRTSSGLRTLGLTVTELEGSELGTLIVFQDLTELRRIEEDLKRADRLASLGTLAAQLAHEIRNPLAAMRGSAQLLVQDPGTDPGSARLVAILLRESDRLSKLVEDFLRFARPPPPNKQELELEVLVAETVDMLRADPIARQVRVETVLAPLRVPVDADQLRQVLINILRNAFQAAGEGGGVRVSLEALGEQALLRIWDSAGSIPASDLSRIFEPFFSTREGGTGLGLSTAYSIVRAHGGNIRVSSSPREGTEFLIQLPLQG
ncbi:two-component system sensor histidine kinase NtrB [Archangium lipolyticum]|uniref:two-component system sensor histidine kinase NtrB n=1 Tax=Archangium lipolyticum TaxID=2970465 RepID=UPI002DD6344F|nr:ATP-binding protein [Archangium lipolyticum]